ncbi:hypothetical protein ACN27G_06095 [Plantactinospora sp. WMMB334]|uniref:hypothetical protein n=1 Tax=Plantactinospora sp. WMMB334 TaxID=3404119 RepID=UPI003B926BA8
MTKIDPARVLAVLAVMGWPDDRGNDYRDEQAVMPAEAHYRLAEEIVQAVDKATPADTGLRDAHARGYADAVAVLRDDERYERWWTAREYPPDAQYWRAGARGHLADYLRIVGPDGVDVSKPTTRPAGPAEVDPLGLRDRLAAVAEPDRGEVTTASGQSRSRLSREELIALARPGHDQACHCDPKYVMSCPQMTAAILALARSERPNATEETRP